jgi:hypothetical protein
VTIMIITIIILNVIIRYLNFNLNSPIITNCWNHRIKILLRQRYQAACFYLSIYDKAWGKE